MSSSREGEPRCFEDPPVDGSDGSQNNPKQKPESIHRWAHSFYNLIPEFKHHAWGWLCHLCGLKSEERDRQHGVGD